MTTMSWHYFGFSCVAFVLVSIWAVLRVRTSKKLNALAEMLENHPGNIAICRDVARKLRELA